MMGRHMHGVVCISKSEDNLLLHLVETSWFLLFLPLRATGIQACELLGDSYVCPFHLTTRVLDYRCEPLDPAFSPLHCLIRSSDWYSKHFYP